LYIQPSPATFLPHHHHTHTHTPPQNDGGGSGGGDAAVIAHNPLLTTLFAVGYSQGGGIAVFSTHHSLPLMTCTDPWARTNAGTGATGTSNSNSSGGGILCISWMRERPHTLLAVSSAGSVALWDLGLVCAGGGATAPSGEVLPHCVFVPPPTTTTTSSSTATTVVSAVCSGGSGLHPYTLSPVSVILAHASGQVTALALHPVWYLPEEGPEGGEGRRLAAVQRALEG
jgi:hypothetical protein